MALEFVIAEGAVPDLEIETEFLHDASVNVRIAPLGTPTDVARETAEADGVVVSIEPMHTEFIEQLGPKVKIIGRAGIGLDAIDLDAAQRRGIAVFHTPDYATEEVATHALALLLALNRKIVECNALARSAWNDYERLLPVDPLSEATIGIIGLGRIGRAIIDRLLPFRATILGFDPYVSEPPSGVNLTDNLDTLLAKSDIVSLHLPVTPETEHLIGSRELAQLKPGAVIINVSRGRLIDQAALTEALEAGRLRAGLDVLEVEPPPADTPLLGVQTALLSPHFAWYSTSSERRVRTETLAGMINYIEGTPITSGRLVVDPHEAHLRRARKQ